MQTAKSLVQEQGKLILI